MGRPASGGGHVRAWRRSRASGVPLDGTETEPAPRWTVTSASRQKVMGEDGVGRRRGPRQRPHPLNCNNNSGPRSWKDEEEIPWSLRTTSEMEHSASSLTSLAVLWDAANLMRASGLVDRAEVPASRDWPAGVRGALSLTLQRPGDRSADVSDGQGSFRSGPRPGPPVLGRVRLATLVPGVLARLPASDCLPPAATALVPLPWPPSMLTRIRCLVRPTKVCPPTCRAPETGHRRSAKPGCVEERRAPPRVRDSPPRLCHGRTPAGVQPPLAQKPCREWSLPSGTSGPSASGKPRGFGAALPWPTVRLPTLRGAAVHDRRKAGDRRGRAHPWPGGTSSRWTIHEVSW